MLERSKTNLSFKLARTDEEIKVPQPDEGPDDLSSAAPSEKKFKDKAKAIAQGRAMSEPEGEPTQTGNVGRDKRTVR